MSKSLRLKLSWLLYWFFVTGIVNLVIRPLGYNYQNHSLIYSSVFLIGGVGCVFLFRVQDKVFQFLFQKKSLIYLIVPLIFFYGLAKTIDYYFPLSEIAVQKFWQTKILFPLFQDQVYISKLWDILFQQILIWVYFIVHENLGISQKKQLKHFMMTFVVIHLPLVFIYQIKSLIFIIPSCVGGFLFAWPILFRKENGRYIALALHQGFYLVAGVLLRTFFV